jgi:DNA ligase (NAD+)
MRSTTFMNDKAIEPYYANQIRTILKSQNVPTEDVLIELLTQAADDYNNGDGESAVTDAEYDALYLLLQAAFPHSKHITAIGSEVRGGKVKLPHVLGSMDQVYTGQAAKWISDNKWQQELFVLGNKEDGYSCLAVYGRNGKLQIAYSRGNGFEGADVTRHVKRIKNFPLTMSIQCDVRLEIIINKQVFFDQLQDHPETMLKGNKIPYRTPRNYVSGRMNASISSDWFYDNVRVIATSVVEPKSGKKEQYQFLQENGWDVPNHIVVKGMDINDDMLITYLNKQREESPTEIDGVVIDLDDKELRASLRRKSSSINPMYSKKFKVGSDDNIAFPTVVKVHYEPSKIGYLKPRIELEPVELQGVTITFCTGFNAKFIRDNNIGPGAIIQLTRSGDVIPFIQKVVQPASAPQLPLEQDFGKFEWTEGEVDLKIIDIKNNRDVQINNLIDIFTKLEVPFLKEGSIIKLFDAGYVTAPDIIKGSLGALKSIVGESAGEKIYEGIKKKLNPVLLSNLIGSSNTLGRGIGRRRTAKLLESVPNLNDWSVKSITAVEGFEDTTATSIMNNLPHLHDFLNAIDGYYTIQELTEKVVGGSLSGKTFVFTGYRDKQAEQEIQMRGGLLDTKVNKITTYVVTDDVSGSSSKLVKARTFSSYGVQIITPEQLAALLA